jgi:hypothetical protein
MTPTIDERDGTCKSCGEQYGCTDCVGEIHAILEQAGARDRAAFLDDAVKLLIAERDDLRAVGDRLQSEASRLAEWAESTGGMPYEVHQSFIAIRSAVKDWTRHRVGHTATSSREERHGD